MVRATKVASKYLQMVLAQPAVKPDPKAPGPGPATPVAPEPAKPAPTPVKETPKVTLEETEQKQNSYPAQLWNEFAEAFLKHSKNLDQGFRRPVEGILIETGNYIKKNKYNVGPFGVSSALAAAFGAVKDVPAGEQAQTVLKAFVESWSLTLRRAMHATLPDKPEKHYGNLYSRFIHWKPDAKYNDAFEKAVAAFDALRSKVSVQRPGEEKAPGAPEGPGQMPAQKGPGQTQPPEKKPWQKAPIQMPVTNEQKKMLKEMHYGLQNFPRWKGPKTRDWFFNQLDRKLSLRAKHIYVLPKTWDKPYEEFEAFFGELKPTDRANDLKQMYRYYNKVKPRSN